MRTLSSSTQELAGLRVAHQIDAADVRVDAARHLDADHLATKVPAGIDQRARNLAIVENALRPVDILQKEIERDHALRKPALDAVPFRVGEDARDQVEREKTLGAAAVAVDREGDALEQKRKIGQLAALFELRRCDSRQLLKDLLVMSARIPTPGEHLIVEISRIVSIEQKRTQGL